MKAIFAFLAFTPILIYAQAQSSKLEFEVASVRPSQPSPQERVELGLHLDGSQVRINSLDMQGLIAMAFRLRPYQVSGPDWMHSTRFDVTAKLPAGATADQIPEMLQALLADRFQLKFHRDKRELSVYAIVIGKPPLKLQESAPDANDAPPPRGTNIAASGGADGVSVSFGNGSYYTFADGKFIIKRVSMDRMAAVLERYLDRPLLNLTDLKGTYDLAVDLTPEDYRTMLIRAGVNSGVVLPPEVLRLLDSGSISSLTDGVAQVGLKLDARKSPVDTVVVDQMSKAPTDN